MLKLDDGFARGRPECKSEVMHLQRCLISLNFPVIADGLFGLSTQSVVKQFQLQHQLPETGEVDNKTWLCIEQQLKLPTDDQSTPEVTKSVSEPTFMTTFAGNLAWIHNREGHAGKAYWPGGASGVTLDPGFDLGYQEPEAVKNAYKNLLSPEQLEACLGCSGIHGNDAKSHLNQSKVLLGIRISESQALSLFPSVIEPYWTAICKRFPNLSEKSCPSSVQTALLSLAYNRGANNRYLSILDEPISRKDWLACASEIASMQQDHSLAGIRSRRKMEAALIQQSLV